MVGTFREILDSSFGNLPRITSMTNLRVLAFVVSTEAKYSSTELNLGDFVSFRLLVGRFFRKRVQAPNDYFERRARITNQVFRAMNSAT
jgi:hypothetical protein